MLTHANRERLLFGLGFMALAVVTLTWGAAVWFVMAERQSIHYPGALRVSDHNIFTAFPRLATRRDTSFRSPDDFPAVYNWYTTGFDLGGERQAQSRCVHLFGSNNWLTFMRTTSVTLCDTPTGQMIFVQRSIFFEYP